jgi:CubicO group peptidase (beta-lactamase class C family)/endonuclease YncB( thermonuclease family)
MKKLLLLLILSLFSLQSYAGSCPDGSDPVRSISADGTYFVYNCAGSINDASSSTNSSSANTTVSNKNNSKGIDRFGGDSEIPEEANPNDETLKFYLYRYLYSHNIYPYCGDDKYLFCEDMPPQFSHPVEASNNPYQFHSELREDNYVKKQMQDSPLLSYLLFEDGKIVIDEITPKDRFGEMFRNTSKFHSQSISKTFISYMVGHAICKGYIDSVDSRLDDWPILQDTLYHNQKLIDVLNMAAGTQDYFIGSNKFKNSSRAVTNPTVKDAMENELKGSKKSYSIYNYNNMNPILLGSYLIYKLGDEKFQELLDDVFQKKARIEGDVFFLKNISAKKDDISMWSQFYATRYDYLRIAKAMLDDWENDTCAGQYLKTIYERRIPKNREYFNEDRVGLPLGYAGFFHTNYKGMANRPVMGMDGYGGQTILIDFERGRIIATLSIHDNMKFPKPGSFDFKKIAYERIKNGKPASGIKKPQELTIDPQQIILKQKANKETERNAKENWDNYYKAMDEKLQGVLFGGSEDGSTMFIEDFENLDQRDLRVDDRDDHWLVKQDSDGNSIYCNKNVISTSDYAHFNLGSENWRDYSISYRMKFTPGRGGELETHIRKNSNRQGEYRSVIDNMMGYTFLKYVKGADRINKRIANGSRAPIRDKWADIQLIASGNNISYIVNGKVVASTKDDRLKKGAAMFAVTSKSELCIDDIVIKKVSKTAETETAVAKKVETSDSDPTVSKIIEVTHGDKLIVDIAEPHEFAGSNIKVSLKDIDAPDATRSCPKQMELGLKAKDYVAQKLEDASSIKLTNLRKTNTKIIAQVIVDGLDLGEELVSKGYASEEYGYWKPYFCSALSATNQADQYVDTDQKKAIFWYERSIVLDPKGSKNQESHFALSQMYSNFGNADKSLENLKKSASLGWIPAMEQLGSDYLNGNGVKKDPNQGKKWLKKAFDKGSQRAEDIYCGSLPKAKQKTCKF